VDVLLLAELYELRLEKTRVTLDLVGSGCDAGAVDESLQVLLSVVGNANSASLLLGQLCHRLPCVDNRDVVKHLDVASILQREKAVVRVARLVESNGEMHKIQVEIFETELGKAVVESCGDILRAMLRIPELGCDEDVLALKARDLAAEGLLESLRNLLLVAVDLCEVQVAVAGLECFEDGGLDLTRLGLPGAKTQLTVNRVSNAVLEGAGYSRDFGACVEGNGSSEGHVCGLGGI
jgi:hypothetical protein